MERLFTKKEYRTYSRICSLSEPGVMQMMHTFLKQRYDRIIYTPLYIIAIGDVPIGLCAHADTVFSRPPRLDNFFYDQERNVVWNPDGAGADDRAGIFAIIDILKHTDLRPSIIITTGEESCCYGSSKLCYQVPTFPVELKFLIQLDRRGKNDAVYYDCANEGFTKYINNFGFETAIGSYTDISVLAPHFGCAAVNLSIGYYDEHTNIERLHVGYMFDTIDKVLKILHDHQNAKFYEYIERPHNNVIKSVIDYYNGTLMCAKCGNTANMQEILPIDDTTTGKYINICLDCYAKLYDKIAWCNQCYKGVLFDKPIDRDSLYTCEDCKKHSAIKITGLKKIKK